MENIFPHDRFHPFLTLWIVRYSSWIHINEEKAKKDVFEIILLGYFDLVLVSSVEVASYEKKEDIWLMIFIFVQLIKVSINGSF